MRKEREMEIEEAFNGLKDAIQNDQEYAWGWHCNIAMAAYDEGLDHASANRAANTGLRRCVHHR